MQDVFTKRHDVVVIGSGLAGLAAAWRERAAGRRVVTVSRHFGGTQHLSGAFDVLDFNWLHPDVPALKSAPVAESLWQYIQAHPRHLYAQLFSDQNSCARLPVWIQDFLKYHGVPFAGNGETSVAVVDHCGRIRQAAFAMPTHVFSLSLLKDCCDAVWLHVPGLTESPLSLIQKNLRDTVPEIRVLAYDGFNPNLSSPLASLISALEDASRFEAFCAFLSQQLKPQTLVFMPPLLGRVGEIFRHADLEKRTGCRFVELLSGLPSVSGLRFTGYIESWGQAVKATHIKGQVLSAAIQQDQVLSLKVQTETGEFDLHADQFVLASGKYAGGGVVHQGSFQEPIFDLPLFLEGQELSRSTHVTQTLSRSAQESQGFMRLGLAWDKNKFRNLKICGHVLEGFDFTREFCGVGVSVASALV